MAIVSMIDHLVTTADEARNNIGRYAAELARSEGLRDIMSYARGWYACRDESGAWILAPSKFAGYAANDAAAYLKSHNQRDGRLAERVLGQWFEDVQPGSATHADLLSVLRAMFARAGKTPNKLIQLHVLASELSSSRRTGAEKRSSDAGKLIQRITTNPDVLGGRPTIRGLRIAVSDILDLLAAGVTREEILADYPYLEGDDIAAALDYAARVVDHRVIRAA